MYGSVPFLSPLVGALLSGAILALAGSFALSAFWDVGAAAVVRLLLIPRRPRFIMLAGVTGVIGDVASGVLGAAELEGDRRAPGGAGGGIDRSTGDGESVSMMVLFLRVLVERRRGVFVALLACLMDCFAVDAGEAVEGPRFRTARAASSALGDIVRLFGERWL